MTNISAVLFTGGESRRMGKDKATLLFRGKPLWQTQLDLLQRLDPTEIFISARSDPSWRPNEVRFIADDPPSRGPLSGLAAALGRIRTTHVLALAVDMPFMTETYLRLLCDLRQPGCGVLPMIGDRAEPLAAIYPAQTHVDLVAALRGNDFSLQTITARLVEHGKLRSVQVSEEEKKFFGNINEAADLN